MNTAESSAAAKGEAVEEVGTFEEVDDAAGCINEIPVGVELVRVRVRKVRN